MGSEYPDDRSLFQKSIDGLASLGWVMLDGLRAIGDFASDYLLPGGRQRRADKEDHARLRREDRARRREARRRPKTGGDAPAPSNGNPAQLSQQTGSTPTQERPRTGDSPPASGPTPQPLIFGIEKGNQDTGPAAAAGSSTGSGGMSGGFA